ncbi:MAG: sigma-70 family RNA polymerase sigma factor [Desulfobacterales bacterium]
MDLLATSPSQAPFATRVKELSLSPCLEEKTLHQEGRLPGDPQNRIRECCHLTAADEKELATEVLLLRHRFTELVLNSGKFRQAALTVVQNIYLFRNRRIFFGSNSRTSSEEERLEALHLFSANPSSTSIPLAKSFQHLILARVWHRILSTSTQAEHEEQEYTTLHGVVEKLNTIRNIYILLTMGLVRKLAARINKIYKESVTFEDAIQIGSFGVARASYRYHPSSGVRFSTFSANWVFKEIQRQSLEGRLIRLSSNTVERYSRAVKDQDTENLDKFLTCITDATPIADATSLEDWSTSSTCQKSNGSPLAGDFEAGEVHAKLLRAIDEQLSAKCGDIIKRRYGFPPYRGKEQSVIAISKIYEVTRGSIYQREQTALKRLICHLEPELL